MTNKSILIFSGGLDSTVLLMKLLSEGREVKCLSFNYGQRHARELQAAGMIATAHGIEHRVVDLFSIKPLLAGSSQTDDSVAVPHGHYAEDSMKKTVVPNRNMVMLSIAGAWAMSLKYDLVIYGAHSGDHVIYPDCRESFVRPLAEAMGQADWHPVSIERPFIGMTKADIVKLGISLGAQPEMGTSYSCYEGGEVHCGKCGTCVERREAFELAGVTDPTHYNP